LTANHVDAGKIGSHHCGRGNGKISHRGVSDCRDGFAATLHVCHPMPGMTHHGRDNAAARDEHTKIAEAVAFDADETLKIVDASNFSGIREVPFAAYEPQAAPLRTEQRLEAEWDRWPPRHSLTR